MSEFKATCDKKSMEYEGDTIFKFMNYFVSRRWAWHRVKAVGCLRGWREKRKSQIVIATKNLGSRLHNDCKDKKIQSYNTFNLCFWWKLLKFVSKIKQPEYLIRDI